MKRNPEVHALVLRKVGETLRDSVYAQYRWAISQLGLEHEFRATVSPMEITYLPTGQKIFFRGADKPDKIKSIKVPFGYIGITHFEELDQFAGREEVRKITQSTMRGGDKFWNFETFNPPQTASNWANKDILIPRADRLVHRSCYTDVPREWLGEQFFIEADELKRANETAYRHEYLGEITGTGAQVFDNLEIRAITDEEIKTFGAIYDGLDWGFFPDPFQWIRCSYNPATMTLYIFDELRLYRTGNREAYAALIKKGVSQYADISADNAEPKSIADFKEFGFYSIRPAMKGTVSGEGSVAYSMKWLQSIRKIVIDPVRCPNAATEFQEYEMERNTAGEIISGYPDANNHCIDATRYSLDRVWRRKGQ
jgi:PBSX family phage terminase large subunit